jgi:hypothetical protein
MDSSRRADYFVPPLRKRLRDLDTDGASSADDDNFHAADLSCCSAPFHRRAQFAGVGLLLASKVPPLSKQHETKRDLPSPDPSSALWFAVTPSVTQRLALYVIARSPAGQGRDVSLSTGKYRGKDFIVLDGGSSPRVRRSVHPRACGERSTPNSAKITGAGSSRIRLGPLRE